MWELLVQCSAQPAYLQGKVQEASIFHVPHSNCLEGRQIPHDCKLSNEAVLLTHLSNVIPACWFSGISRGPVRLPVQRRHTGRHECRNSREVGWHLYCSAAGAIHRLISGGSGLPLGCVIWAIAHDHVRGRRRGTAHNALGLDGRRHEHDGLIHCRAIPTDTIFIWGSTHTRYESRAAVYIPPDRTSTLGEAQPQRRARAMGQKQCRPHP